MNTVPKNAREYLIEFANDSNCNPWIKSVIYTYFISDGDVAESDKGRLVEELLYGKSSEIDDIEIVQHPMDSQRVELVSLHHITGVNALADNQIIRFGSDLNIVYGLNGTGKSGYFRIINDAIGGAKKKPIIGNIYKEDKKPQAKIEYKYNGRNAEYDWDCTVGANQELTTVRVFDTSYTDGLLRKRSSDELLVKPFQLYAFSELISLIDELLLEAQQVVIKEEQALPVLDSRFFSDDTKEILSREQFSAEDEKRIYDLGVIADNADETIKDIQKEIKQLQQLNINDKIRLETEHKKAVSDLTHRLEKLYTLLKEYEDETAIAISVLVNKKNESDAALLRFENLRSIPGIESDSWRDFVSSGEKYLRENNVQVCPYCHRPYDETALELVTSYSEYLAEESVVEYKKQLSAIENLRSKIEQVGIVAESDYSFEYLSEDIKNGITDFLRDAEELKTDLLKSIDKNSFPTSVIKSIDYLRGQLSDFISDSEKQLESLNSDADKKEKRLIILEAELDNLLEKKSVSNQIESIKRLLAEKRNIHNKKIAISKISTTKISNLSRKAHNELLTEKLELLFGETLKDLGIKDINIQLKSQNTKGVQQTELAIKGIKTVDDILSEGEQKATALALFLSEIIMSENHSTLVFDDPVNSLDHRMLGAFAEKLLKMDNQIIVFTHNRLFLESFEESDNGHFCKTYDTACNKNKGRHILVYETLSEGRNCKGVISKKQIETAMTHLEAVEELLKEYPFTKKQEACVKLRIAVEFLVDEVVFNKQIPTRYSTKSDRINWNELKNISNDSKLIDTLKEVHRRCSGAELHNGMERSENPLDRQDIQEMLNKLKVIVG